MSYRPPRPGDLIAVREGERERQWVIRDVADDGRTQTIAAEYGTHRVDVVIRRVGLTPTELTVQIITDIVDAFDAVKAKLDPVVHDELDTLKTAVEARFTKVEADLKAALDKLAALEKAAQPAVAAAATEVETAAETVVEDAVKGA